MISKDRRARGKMNITKTMDSECAELLPLVCTVLVNPKQSLPDDTCFEKLLDWFKDLTKKVSGASLLQHNPCLTELISSVCKLKTNEPTVLSFVLRLVGILAATEEGFCFLEEQDILHSLFGNPGLTHTELWDEAIVRSGWINGLWSMLQHWRVMHFIIMNDFTKMILNLQIDRSLFVASAANQLLAHILNFPKKVPAHSSSDNSDIWQNSVACECNTYAEQTEWANCSIKIAQHLGDALHSDISFHTHQSLRLLTLALVHCQPQVMEVLWQKTEAAIKTRMGNGQIVMEQPFLEVLLTASRTALLNKEDSNLVNLMDLMLCTLNPTQAIPFALGIFKLENCPHILRSKAIQVILQPLDCIMAAIDEQQQSSVLEGGFVLEKLATKKQLSQKGSCSSLLCLSLYHTEELLCMDTLHLEVPGKSLFCSVLTVLRACIGMALPCSSKNSNIFKNLIGCTKVQKSAMDTLSRLAQCSGSSEFLSEAFLVLHEYLQNSDTDSSVGVNFLFYLYTVYSVSHCLCLFEIMSLFFPFQVLTKAMQAVLNWLFCCSEIPLTWLFLKQDLFSVLEKRLCDVRWEVRDSTLEFLTRLTIQFQDKGGFPAILMSTGVPSLLHSLLSDPESYVRASAICALGQTSFVMGKEEDMKSVPGVQELASHLVDILANDTECFPRRAVVRVFSKWLKHPSQQPIQHLEKNAITVLDLGSNDLDWEVKIHTLELAEIWISQTLAKPVLSCCPYTVALPTHSVLSLTESIQKLLDLKIFDVLFNGLFDCDRPVAQKACSILLSLKRVIIEDSSFTRCTLTYDLKGQQWAADTLTKYFSKRSESVHVSTDQQRQLGIVEVLSSLDLEAMQQTLGQSSDHIENSPRSLLKDILAATHTTADNAVDCY
nr:PREDICTED: BRCA1-associated ATM activator 1 isoform X2 [Lepisosteus oculatus]